MHTGHKKKRLKSLHGTNAQASSACGHRFGDDRLFAFAPLAAAFAMQPSKPKPSPAAAEKAQTPSSAKSERAPQNMPATQVADANDDAATPEELAVHHAMTMLGKPYRGGGANPNQGFDASGLVHYSFGKAGVKIPRSNDEQRKVTARVLFSGLRLADLVYFDLDGKKNSHVGIYIGDGKFVHAAPSGKRVRLDRLDTPYWREQFSEARRLDGRRSATP
jgi:cell wall-associated NlpC family hydrolase